MVRLRLYHGLIIALLTVTTIVYAEDLRAPDARQLSAEEDEKQRDNDSEMHDDEYAAWLENEIDEQIALLESIMGVSEALSVADAALDDLDEDFLEEVLSAKLKREQTVRSESERQLSNNPIKHSKPLKQKTPKRSSADEDLEQLLEMAVSVLGSMASNSERIKGSNIKDDRKQVLKPTRSSCLHDRTESAKCTGNFQRWIVYENGGFCKPTADGECQGMWYQHQEPVDCIEVCIYAPSPEEKKLSIRLAPSQPSSVDQYNDTSPAS